jgi:hypothetical protein
MLDPGEDIAVKIFVTDVPVKDSFTSL